MVQKKPELPRQGPTKVGPVYVLVKVAPPSVERYMMFLRLVPQPEVQPLPPFSSMPATYTSPACAPDLSTVIWTSRTKTAPAGIGRFTGALQVRPLSVERMTEMGGPPRAKLLKEMYIRLAKGEDGFWSTTPELRSSEAPL